MERTPSRQVVTSVVAAAGRVLATAGPEGLSARAVAAEAGISVQTIYNRFGSFDAVLDDLADKGFRDLGKRILDLQLAPLPDAGDPLAVLIEALRRYRSFALEQPRLHRFLFEVELSARTRRTAQETLSVIAVATRNAVDAGLLLPGPPAELSRRLLAATHGSLQLELSGWAGGAAAGGHDAVVATMVRGLRPGAQLR